MKKPSILILVFLSVLLSSCSDRMGKDWSRLGTATGEKDIPVKEMRRMRYRMPDGVISADIVNQNGRLHLLTGTQEEGQKTLWYRFSDDHGQSWSSPVKVLADDNLPANMNRGKDAQIAAQGNTVVVTWMKFTEDRRFNVGPMLSARSTDGGKTWVYTDAPPSWNKGPHGYTDLIADDHAFHAVWLDSRLGNSKVMASQALHYAKSTDGGKHWQPDQTLDGLTCSCCWNSLKTDMNGNTYVLYRDKKPSDLSLGLVDSNARWEYLSHVGAFDWQFEGCPHIGGGLDIQLDGTKQRFHAVAGTGHPDYLGVHYLSSEDRGRTWSRAKQLGDDSAIHADVAAHDDGRVVAVWDMMGDYGLAVFKAESGNQGRSWSQPEQLSGKGMRASHPRIVKTGTGFLALWTQSDGQTQTLSMQRL